jgi:hypothetical protein
MSLEADFQAALAHSKTLPGQPPATQLMLYGLFKQATVGDVQGKRPGALDLAGKVRPKKRRCRATSKPLLLSLSPVPYGPLGGGPSACGSSRKLNETDTRGSVPA